MALQNSNYNQANAELAYDTAQTVKVEQESGIIDMRYVKGIPGILKIVEILCSLIAYICVEATLMCAPWLATFGYFKFISMFCFTTTLILYVMLLLKLPARILRCDCVNFPFVEMCYYGGLLIFLFFGNIFLAVHGCLAGHRAGTAFGFFAMFAYIGDGGFALRAWRAARKEAREQQSLDDVASPGSEPRY